MLYYKLEKISNAESFYAQAIKSGKVSMNEITDEIVQNCSATRADVILVLTELADVMRQHLLNGEDVSILDLGTFSVSINGKAVKNPDDFVPEKHITRFRINFRPITRRRSEGKDYYPILSGIKAYRL